MSTEKCESYRNSRKTSSVGCISWLSHLLPHRHHGKLSSTSILCYGIQRRFTLHNGYFLTFRTNYGKNFKSRLLRISLTKQNTHKFRIRPILEKVEINDLDK